ncbi:MAG: glycosyltransferase family 4 protein [Bacteroidaceae bacterium]|nr:glycosyltransferase family 4 protein [Bacteroidaceae bacterium]
MKRVLIHTLIFSPDGVSTAYLYNDIARRLQERGYEVVVLTTTPHFNIVPEQVALQPMHWKVWGLCKVSRFHGMTVLHVPQKKFKSTMLRLLGFIYWHIVSFFIGLTVRHVDLILSPSPPLTIGLLNLWMAALKGCRVVYNVQEIYPDILKLKGGFALKFLRWMERKVYNGSDAVTTIDQVFYDTIVPRFKDKSKLHIIPNFVDTELYRQVEWENTLDARLFPKNDSIKLLYAGNIGHAQSWEPLIALAEKTRDLNVEYIVIGEGAKRGYVEEEIQKRGLEKLHLLPYQPRELMPAILSYSDASFIFMAPEKDGDGFPSKVYTIMACERPLLVLSGENTPIINFLKNKGCAKLVTEQDFEKKVDEMVVWLHEVTKEELRSMGKKGVTEIWNHYTKEIVTDKYVDLVDSLLNTNAH